MMWFGCSESPGRFTVKGIVAGADNQMIYLDNVGIASAGPIDSAKLNGSGEFTFKVKRPQYPEFYRLRINSQRINFSIDSTETVSFTADYKTFATSYQVEGSANCLAIKEVTLAQLDASQAIHRARKDFESGMISDSTCRTQTLEAIENYKDIARKHIYSRPMSTESYFALFQQIDGLLFFDPYDRIDSRAYGAVATSYNHLYPESPRAKQLYNLTLQALKVLRGQRMVDFDGIETKEVDFLEVELPDIRGEKIKLSDVAKDKVTILNFTSYQMEWSPELNTLLQHIDSEFRDKGVAIYQVSLDGDVHFWKNVVSSFPWTCVRDPQTVYSQAAAIYNVKQLPALFLLNRKGILVKRIDMLDHLSEDVRQIL
jgi:alkyl hydroperoxide reductase subunit AhpC